jgi:hypothetical protein
MFFDNMVGSLIIFVTCHGSVACLQASPKFKKCGSIPEKGGMQTGSDRDFAYVAQYICRPEKEKWKV